MAFDDLPRLVCPELRIDDCLAATEQRLEHGPLGTTVDEGRDRESDELPTLGTRLREVPLVVDGFTGVPVDPTTEYPEHILLAPDDAFGVAGGSAGVEHVDVVVRPRLEVALGSAVGNRLLIGQPVDGGDVEI